MGENLAGHIKEVTVLIRDKITLWHCAFRDGFHFGMNHIYIPPEPCALLIFFNAISIK